MSSRPAILITGGAKRVGAALSLYFARNGYDIALHYHHSREEARQLKIKLEALGAACALFSHDVSDIAGIPALMANVKKKVPHCTALINNASVFERAGLMETDEALFDLQFTVNLKAPFFLTQAFAKTFKEGCVVNILDTYITQTEGSHFAYLLSKKALASFTEMAARALGPDIRVNGVCPGVVMPAAKRDIAFQKSIKEKLPLRSHPILDELAETVRWLLLQQHITGQLIYVDGGKHVL